jgi:hypothetical protein
VLTWVLQPVDHLLPEALCLVDGHGVCLHDDWDDGHMLGQLSHVAAGTGGHTVLVCLPLQVCENECFLKHTAGPHRHMVVPSDMQTRLRDTQIRPQDSADMTADA